MFLRWFNKKKRENRGEKSERNDKREKERERGMYVNNVLLYRECDLKREIEGRKDLERTRGNENWVPLLEGK